MGTMESSVPTQCITHVSAYWCAEQVNAAHHRIVTGSVQQGITHTYTHIHTRTRAHTICSALMSVTVLHVLAGRRLATMQPALTSRSTKSSKTTSTPPTAAAFRLFVTNPFTSLSMLPTKI